MPLRRKRPGRPDRESVGAQAAGLSGCGRWRGTPFAYLASTRRPATPAYHPRKPHPRRAVTAHQPAAVNRTAPGTPTALRPRSRNRHTSRDRKRNRAGVIPGVIVEPSDAIFGSVRVIVIARPPRVHAELQLLASGGSPGFGARRPSTWDSRDHSRDHSLYEEGPGVKRSLRRVVDALDAGGQWLSSLYCLLGGEDLVGGTLR